MEPYHNAAFNMDDLRREPSQLITLIRNENKFAERKACKAYGIHELYRTWTNCKRKSTAIS